LLGLAMMNAPQRKRTAFDLEDAAVAVDAAVARQFPTLDEEERRREAKRWLAFECLGSGIVEEMPGRRVRFWHLTFQEFLAALQLAWKDDGESRESSWWPPVREHLDAAQWRETIELFPGCLLEEGGEGRVDKLLERVLRLRAEGDLASEARVAGIVGRLLQTLVADQYRPRPETEEAYETALRKSLEIFTPGGAAQVPIEVRIAAAEALGRGGDPRLAQDNLLEVPGLGGVRLGKYPVTVEEYQRFVESRGYEEAKYWDRDGWTLREKEGWSAPGSWDGQLETPNRPVTEVSWHEAVAFCRWLTEQRGEPVRLPTQTELETAATPGHGEYPWGAEEPDGERANFDNAVGTPTPVGIYPAGDGPFGHCDVAGNVCEWCEDKVEVDESETLRASRGGGWFDSAGDLRAAVRVGSPARFRYVGIGFRVAAAPASP
jgi:formylglycine-generating enzyme required for sulfatase activity